MKRFLLVLSLAFVFISCNSGGCKKVRNPEDIGDQVVYILSKIDKMDYDDFQSCFASVEDVVSVAPKEFAKEDNLEEKRRDDLTDDLEDLKDFGQDEGIEWSTVKLVDFEFRTDSRERDGESLEFVEGKTVFEVSGQLFQIESASVKINGSYVLGQLDHPRRK